MLNLLRKGLGRSKPQPTLRQTQTAQLVEISTISNLTELSSIGQKSTTILRELGYLFLTKSSLHIIASDLDVRDHTAMDDILG
jgi:hypothetical protein